MVAFRQYSKTYNKFCFSYSGRHKDYVFLLNHIKTRLQKHYYCEITLHLHPEMIHLCDSVSSIEKYDYGQVIEIKVNPKVNTLFELIKDCPPSIFSIEKKYGETRYLCPTASYPNENLKMKIKHNKIITRIEEFPDYGTVIGVGGECFWYGTLKGFKPILISGNDDKLFQFICPEGEIWS